MVVAAVIALYFLLQLGMGIWAARRVQDEADYLVAGRRLGIPMATFSLFATWFGAETVMGSSAAVAELGLAGGRADPFGYTLCLVLMAVLLAHRLREGEHVTIGDFFRRRFGGNVEKGAIAILVPTSVIWAAAQLLAFAQVIAVVAGLEVRVALAAATTLVIVYTFLGGLMGDVLTDLVQGGILIVGLSILLYFVLEAAGGVTTALARIEPSQLVFVGPGESLWSRLDTWAVPVLGSIVSQEALTRVMAARSASVARRSAFAASGLYLLIGAVPVLIALVGTHVAPELGHRDEFLPTLAHQVLPPALFAVLMGALVSAILSTVDSSLLTIASLTAHTYVIDRRPQASEAYKVRLNRAMVVVAGLVSALVALSGDNIYELVVLASSFGTAGVLVVVVVGLWTRYGGPLAAGCTLVVGALVTLGAEHLAHLDAPFITALACSVATYVVIGRFERGRRSAAAA